MNGSQNPTKNGLIAASQEFNPLSPVQQINAYCRGFKMEKILMITSDLASFRQVGFVELLRISPSSRLSDYGVRLKIDGQENRLLIKSN